MTNSRSFNWASVATKKGKVEACLLRPWYSPLRAKCKELWSQSMRLLRLAKTVPLLFDQFFRSRTELSDADISVREHANCQGNYRLQYEG